MSLETRQEVDGEKDGEKDFLSSRPRPGERWTEAVTMVGVFPACISRTNPPLLSVVSTATSEPPSFPAAAMGTTSPAWTGLLLLCLTSCNVSCRKTDLRSAVTVKVGCLQFVKCFFFFFLSSHRSSQVWEPDAVQVHRCQKNGDAPDPLQLQPPDRHRDAADLVPTERGRTVDVGRAGRQHGSEGVEPWIFRKCQDYHWGDRKHDSDHLHTVVLSRVLLRCTYTVRSLGLSHWQKPSHRY